MKLLQVVTKSGKISGSRHDVTALTLKEEQIDDVDGVEQFGNLRRLDLSKNSIRNVCGVSQCLSISWLSLASNQISDVSPLRNLSSITVLNLSYNKIEDVSPILLLTGIKALILNNNELRSFPSLQGFKDLNTLILSHNKLEELGEMNELPSLRKLSISHNQLRSVPELSNRKELQEFRANNNLLESLDPKFLRNCPRLHIVDIGNNKLPSLDSLKNIFSSPIHNINVAGNPLCTAEEDFALTLQSKLKKVQIINGKKLAKKPSAEQPIDKKKHKERRGHKKLGGAAVEDPVRKDEPEAPTPESAADAETTVAEKADAEPGEGGGEKRKRKKKGGKKRKHKDVVPDDVVKETIEASKAQEQAEKERGDYGSKAEKDAGIVQVIPNKRKSKKRKSEVPDAASEKKSSPLDTLLAKDSALAGWD